MSHHEFMYRMNFPSFVDFAFRELHPDEIFEDNWHIQLVAGFLQQIHQLEGEGPNRMIINLPPGYLKTHICVIAFSCWVLGRNPRKSILIMSENPELARQLQEQCEELMSSRRYRFIFKRTRIRKSTNSLELTYGGGIRHAGINYGSQHKKSDIVIIDNPQSLHSLDRSPPESLSEIKRLLKNPKKGLIILATRCLSDNDLSNHFYKNVPGWGRLSLPVIALEDEEWILPPDVHYVRKKGELLQEFRETWEEIENCLAELGGGNFGHQYLQSQYLPPIMGSMDYTREDGTKWQMIGNIDKTYVASKHLNKLREEYLSNRSATT